MFTPATLAMSSSSLRLLAAAGRVRSHPLVSLIRLASSATLPTRPYKLHKLDSGPPASAELTAEQASQYYRQMAIIRRMETAAGNLYKEKAVRGFCHLYTGQEACGVGMEAALCRKDLLVTGYRAHGWVHTRGATTQAVLCELTGRVTGVSKGKGGSMHMYYPGNFFGGNGIVGAQMPLGAGLAFAIKYRGDKQVAVGLCGDGAFNQGQVFEVFNMAKLWDLPCIFVCENNKYAMGTSDIRSSASTSYYTRGDYLPGIWVDAMDLLSVREATRFAREWCLAGKGPILLEMETYRFTGHSMSDPGTSYRTREEVQAVRKTRDPLVNFQHQAEAAGLLSEADAKAIDKAVRVEIDAAVKAAKSDPGPPMPDLYTNVYSQPLAPSGGTGKPERIRGVDLYTGSD